MDDTNTRYPSSTWIMDFVMGNYFPNNSNCSCGEQSPCMKYFCIQCKVGGLCKKTSFHSNHKHKGHPFLQVRKVTSRCAILVQDAKKYHFDTTGIQKFACTKDSFYLLRCKALEDLRGPLQRSVRKSNVNHRCVICKAPIKTENGDIDALYCSLECKLTTTTPQSSMTTSNDGTLKPNMIQDDAVNLSIIANNEVEVAAEILAGMRYDPNMEFYTKMLIALLPFQNLYKKQLLKL